MIRAVWSWPGYIGRWGVGSTLRHSANVATAFVQIWANKGRSILTTLGIIIAVTSIITVVTLVEGFGSYMTKMLQGYGTQYMVVYPDRPVTLERQRIGRGQIDVADINAVRTECPHICRVTPFMYYETEVGYGREAAKETPIRGVTEQYQTIRNYYVDAGRFFGPMDVETGAYVCVLGRSLLKLLGSDDAIIGEHVTISGHRFQVVGLLQTKGSFMGDDQDQTVMIPYTTMIHMRPQEREYIRFLAEATSENDIDQAEGEIRRVLRERHDLPPGQPDDFGVQRQDQMLKEFENFRRISTGVLAGIVSISLVVGGIGIMNVMLVSVTERTKEIGLRKSVGARRRDVMMQFLTEAVVLSSLGGAIGVGLGYVITHLASLHPSVMPVNVPAWSVALGLGFSAGAGILFGIIPAFKAAILHPIDALRHE